MYYVIQGKFIIAKRGLGPYQPDGDTVRFAPDDPGLVQRLPRRGSGPKDPPAVRFEAVDALEKEQETKGAIAARDRVFELLGLAQDSINAGTDGFTIHSAKAGEARGYVLANSLDKHGRLIAFLFTGDPAHTDGALIDPDLDDIRGSVNQLLIEEGLVYPTFYSTLSSRLRDGLAQVAQRARGDGAGLWARAVGTPQRFARIPSVSTLSKLVLFPPLHRRLDDYLRSHRGFDGLASWLRSDPVHRNKAVRIIADDTQTDLPGILRADGLLIQLKYHPEEFVFVDGPPIEVPEPEPIPELPEPAATGDIVIVGVLANASGPERGKEAATLLNTTATPIRLDGWTIRDNSGIERLTGVLPAGRTERVLFQALQLGNRQDSLTLLNPNEEVVDHVHWIDAEEGRTLIFEWPRVPKNED